MKILILLHLAKATDSVSMGEISPLGATYCKRFAQKPVDSRLKNEFWALLRNHFLQLKIYMQFPSLSTGSLYASTFK